MKGAVKYLLKKWRNVGNGREIGSTESVCNLQKEQENGSVLKSRSPAEFNRLQSQCSSRSEEFDTLEEYIVESKCPQINIATLSIVILLIVVFIVLPIVYLLHCFGMLSSHWPADEFSRVLTDHSHSDPRKDGVYHFDTSYANQNHIKSVYKQKKYSSDKDGPKHLGVLKPSPPPKPTIDQCARVSDSLRFDCYPEEGANEKSCANRGCCWAKPNYTTDEPIDDQLNIPYCYYPLQFKGYKFVNVSETSFGSTAYLKRTFSSPYLKDARLLKMDIKYESQKRLRIKIYDPKHTRFEPPFPEVPVVEKATSNPDYRVFIDESQLGFKVIRNSDNETMLLIWFTSALCSFNAKDVGGLLFADQFLQLSAILPSHHLYGLGESRFRLALMTIWQRFTFLDRDQHLRENVSVSLLTFHQFCHRFNSVNIGGFVFADQFLQLSALLPSQFIYGLGEHRSSLKLSTSWQIFTMMNHDQVPSENTNLYGSHPFYLVMEKSGNSHGVFLLNSNAMDVILQPTPAITFRTIGGILDLYFFLGPTPSDVVTQYTDVIGKPFMPPFWGLGFHLCRYGYKTLTETKEVWNRTRAAGIPLVSGESCLVLVIDVQWNDLDYMANNSDFTYNQTTYADPGISAAEPRGTYPPYDEGLKLGIFVKNSSGQPFIGKVWNPVDTVWPDFTHPKTVDYWLDQLKSMHDKFQFDGAWIDMNEPSNFWSGSAHGCENNSLDYPPYTPGVLGGKLFFRTLCMNSEQHAGKHYDVHNLYGFTEAIVTSFVMSEIRERRPFVISRSTFSGHGHYAGHWSGDIASTWYDMKRSVPEMLNFNMFGIPLVGADICGFNGNTTPALCQRWSELGAFYPFSRNHNSEENIPQDPVALGPDVVQAARKSLLTRYSLLPFLYTLFWRAHVDGTTVARPLFFQFPLDSLTYEIDYEFLWGSDLLIVPVLEENATQVSTYLPQSLWYDFYTSALVSHGGKNVTLDAPLDTIPLLVRGGSILPMQEPNVTTTLTRKNNLYLLAAADELGVAAGELYWDDGDSLSK
ncbi:unnamed protein product [Timema podura]|uniref:P-type domain-containing protein n=1 Tax=Timema podura TaxID=61482 RepID=A0ABN7NWM4_TIMPD|nr:unnamed protein product [Timema podura]